MTEPVIPPGARTSDPPQSAENAARVNARAIAFAVLEAHWLAFQLDPNFGLTDDDAARVAGFPGHESYRRRGSDLRANGWIAWKRDIEGKIERRRNETIGGSAGVCLLTSKGRAVFEGES